MDYHTHFSDGILVLILILLSSNSSACGGIITALDQDVMSPNYPSDYPNSVTCVWALKPGQAFQLEFDSFYTESGYDLVQGYSSLSSFTGRYPGYQGKRGVVGVVNLWFRVFELLLKTLSDMLRFVRYKGAIPCYKVMFILHHSL